ncbi:MAG: GTP-binding protein [Lachnospiraceae bacterium]|nr:GTP-binding protein [Lachnospiraceae bacterium]
MLEVPIYLITGFLESGKTTFIQEVLASPDFADGEKTLLLLCEEGEEEYDEKEYSRHNIEIMTVEKEEDLNLEFLEYCQKYYKPYRVFMEFNGMWDVKKFVESRLPKHWEIAQTITLVDGSTFDVYLNNMRSILSNLFSYTEMVIFNRCSLEMDLQMYRRSVKGVNQQAMLSFEDTEGNPLELGKEQPPYDLNADVIDISDVDFGLWYLDMTDTPERYAGKTVRFKGKVMKPRKFPADCFIPGRNAMTCCADDIRFIGYICKSKFTEKLKQKQWLEITAEVKYEYAQEYRGEGPVLYAKHLKSADAPSEDLVYFN